MGKHMVSCIMKVEPIFGQTSRGVERVGLYLANIAMIVDLIWNWRGLEY